MVRRKDRSDGQWCSDVYVLALEPLVLVGQAVRVECMADVAYASQQQMEVLAVSSHTRPRLIPVVAIQQVDSGAQRPALVDSDATELEVKYKRHRRDHRLVSRSGACNSCVQGCE